MEVKVLNVTEVISTDTETHLYGTVALTVNGQPMDVGAVIGARGIDRENARRMGLRGYLTAYFDNGFDAEGLRCVGKAEVLDFAEVHDAVLSALQDAAPRLWRESEALRAAARCDHCGQSAHAGRCEGE